MRQFTFKILYTTAYICSMNYFELFELPIALKIDKSKLAQKYFELQKKNHPDFFAKGTEHEQEQALEISSQLNKALKIFKNPDQTIKYVLQLKELLEEEEKYQLPPAFLMEMMELNEQLADAKIEGETEDIEKINTDLASMESEIYAPVKHILEHYNDDSTPTADLLKVKEYYFKKKYLERILATMQ